VSEEDGMTTPDEDLVAGESRAVLRRALAHLSTQRRDDRSLELLGDVPPDLAEPLVRAMSRIREELQADDGRRGEVPRSGGRLDADAFVALLLRVTDTPHDQP
jgi:hypothetical protein